MEKQGAPGYDASGKPVGPPPVYQEKPPAYQPTSGGYPTQPGKTPQGYHTQPMAQGSFDTGARFDGVAKPNVPVSVRLPASLLSIK